jgi:integrase
VAEVSIDKLPSGLWRARYPGVKSKSFRLKSEAKEYEQAAIELKRNGRVETSGGLRTLAELAAEHMTVIAGELSEKTLKTYRDLWSAHVDERILANAKRQWSHDLANTQLRSLTPKATEEWKVERLNGGAGKQSIRKTMALMQTMLDRAVRDEAITSNPVRAVKKPSGKSEGSALVIAPIDVEKIRASAKLDDTGRMMVTLLAQTGMRPGEARALRWEHVGSKALRVEHGCNPDGTAKATKTKERRNVPLTPTLTKDLKAWRKAQGGSRRLCPGLSSHNEPQNHRRRPMLVRSGLDELGAQALQEGGYGRRRQAEPAVRATAFHRIAVDSGGHQSAARRAMAWARRGRDSADVRSRHR